MKESIGPKRPCEAVEHVAACPHDKLKVTDDHITPRSIGKILKWSMEYYNRDDTDIYRLKHPSVNDPENHQWLSEPCHRQKDHDTALRGEVLKQQMQGQNIPFDVHRQIFEMGNLIPLIVYKKYGVCMEPGVEYDIVSKKKHKKIRV